MTIFGPDISSYQSGLVLSRLADAAFVIAKTTEGTYYTDANYQAWRREAAQLGRPFLWYHFLSGEDAHAQAAHTAANVGGASLPGMLDAEPAGSFSPTLAQIYAYIDAAHAASLNLRLCYLPRWYWARLGSPSLSGLTDRGVELVSSAYPGGSGSPGSIYPGDGAAGWQPYGGKTPLIYQFTNQASDGGQSLDYNAFRGTTAQLAAALNPATAPAAPTPTTSEDDMPVFATGPIEPGPGVVTIVCPPPPNGGAAGFGRVWFSLGCDYQDVTLRVAAYVHGAGWDVKNVVVPAQGDRLNPWGGPLPNGTQKISITRPAGPNAGVAASYLLEVAPR